MRVGRRELRRRGGTLLQSSILINFYCTVAIDFESASPQVYSVLSSANLSINICAVGLCGVCAQATQDLIEAAATKWREVEGDYRDDITAVVVRLPCFPE